MKKVKTEIKSRVATKNLISVGHKLAISLLMVSAFSLGLNFMGMLASPQLAKPIVEPYSDLEPTVTPLKVDQITEASQNIRVEGFQGTYGPVIEFSGNLSPTSTNDLGFLELGSNIFQNGDIASSTHPLALRLWHMEGGGTIPARVINIETSGGDYTLCFPKTVVPTVAYEDFVNPVYFYDVDGTPYYDSLLTRRATSASCNQLLSNKLDLEDISDASVNITLYQILINYETPSEPQIEFHENFSHDFDPIGSLDLVSGNYERAIGYNNYQEGAPFAIQVYAGEEETVIPARVINVNSEGNDYILCLPETVVPALVPPYYDFVAPTYFYDMNGTPYYDALLTERATLRDCNQLLANRLDLNEISDASVNVTVDYIRDDFEYHDDYGPEVEFNTNFNNNWTFPLGSLDLASNEYDYNGNPRPYKEGAPLALRLYGAEYGTTIPARVINIEQFGDKYTLCLPETDTLAWEDGVFIYFYDMNGTPYYDSLLTKKATLTSCGQLLSDKLDLSEITDASVNITVDYIDDSPWVDYGPQVEFATNFNNYLNPIGSLDLASNEYNYNGAYEYQDGAPLALQVFGDEYGTIVPSRVISIETPEGDYTLCLPESETFPWDDQLVPLTYFYNTSGFPYYDALLTQRANCVIDAQDILIRQ